MELTFSCNNCGTVGHVSPLEGASLATCRAGVVRHGPLIPKPLRKASSNSARPA